MDFAISLERYFQKDKQDDIYRRIRSDDPRLPKGFVSCEGSTG